MTHEIQRCLGIEIFGSEENQFMKRVREEYEMNSARVRRKRKEEIYIRREKRKRSNNELKEETG